MDSLCVECSHIIYGYPACAHEMLDGSCRLCGWDGSTSAYTRRLRPH